MYFVIVPFGEIDSNNSYEMNELNPFGYEPILGKNTISVLSTKQTLKQEKIEKLSFVYVCVIV